MKKLLIFHPALAPYRVDFFNELGKLYDLRIVFMTRNNANQAFDQSKLMENATYSVGYLDKHYTLKGRNINFGYWNEIRSFQPDIVLCNEYGMSLWATYLYKKCHLAQFKIGTICDDSVDVFVDRAGVRKWVNRFFSSRIDNVICVNPEVCECYKSIGAKTVSYFPIIYNNRLFKQQLEKSLQLTNQYISDYGLIDKKCFLFVGRLTEVKNLKTLLACLSRVVELKGDNVKLIFVGDGDQRQELEMLTKQLDVERNVVFTGRFEGQELLAWYNISAVQVLISTYEPFGAVVGEALMAGMHSLVSKKVGANCLITGANGRICDERDRNDIIDKMCKMIDDVDVVGPVHTVRDSILASNFDQQMYLLTYDLNK